MVSYSSLLALLALTSLFASTAAWPFGTGACPLRQPAVGGTHLTQTSITKGTLDQGSLTVKLNGVVLTPGLAANFTVGKTHTLTLTASSGTFTGLLFRLGTQNGVDTTAALQVPSGDSQLQVAQTACVDGEGVGGVTHALAEDTTTKSILLRLDEAVSNLPLDVTVVGVNEADEGSTWWYSAYTLNAVGKSTSTTTTTSTTNSTASNSTSLRGNSSSTTAVQATGSDSSSSSSHVSTVFIITTVLLGIISLISFTVMLSSFGCKLRKQSS